MSDASRWSQRWLDPIEECKELRQKLRKGKVLARRGRVSGLTVRPGLVTASVAEDTGASLSVRLRQPVIYDDIWDKVISRMSSSAGSAATLLQGRISEELVQFFEEAGAELFPFDHHDLTYFCTCRDDSSICLHAVAVHHALADVIVGDPLIVLEFRGRSRDDIKRQLRTSRDSVLEDARAEADDADDTEPATSLAAGYWRAGVIPHLAFRHVADYLQEEEALPVIRALGPGPGDVSPDEIADVLAPIVRMSRRRMDDVVGQNSEDIPAPAPDPTSAESLDDLLVAAAWQHGSLTSAFVADALDISKLEARRYLRWLVDEGRLDQVGRARGTRYVPPNQGGEVAEAAE